MGKCVVNMALREDLRYVLEELDKVLKHGVGSSPDVKRVVLDQMIHDVYEFHGFERRED